MKLSNNLEKLKKFIEREEDPDEIIPNALECGYDGDYEEALEILDRGTYLFSNELDDSETKARLWELKARAYVELNLPEEAFDAIEKAIEFDKNEAILWLEKAEILSELKKDSEAVSAINNAIKLAPKQIKDELILAKAYYLGRVNKHKEALDNYNEFLEKNPDEVEALLGKSEELLALGEEKDALKAVEAGLKLEPIDLELLSQKGIVLLDLNNFEESLDCFEKCLEIDSADELLWYNKACILSLLDKKEDALDALTVAISLDEENVTWAKDEQDFDNIKDTKQFIRLMSRVI